MIVLEKKVNTKSTDKNTIAADFTHSLLLLRFSFIVSLLYAFQTLISSNILSLYAALVSDAIYQVLLSVEENKERRYHVDRGNCECKSHLTAVDLT